MQNLQEYHRPKTVSQAIELLQRTHPKTVILSGGTWLTGEGALGHLREIQAVVDIAELGLNVIETRPASDFTSEPRLDIGAAVTLQALVEHELTGVNSTHALHVIGEAARAMAGLNIRNRATIAGAIATADSVSPLVTALLACDAEIIAQVGNKVKTLQLAGFLDYRERILSEGVLITAVRMPLPAANARASYEAVSRTPRDYPIVCAVTKITQLNRGQSATRVALGGVAPAPLRLMALELAIDIKPEHDFLEAELAAALDPITPQSDYLGSADYRKDMARVLVWRTVKATLV